MQAFAEPFSLVLIGISLLGPRGHPAQGLGCLKLMILEKQNGMSIRYLYICFTANFLPGPGRLQRFSIQALGSQLGPYHYIPCHDMDAYISQHYIDAIEQARQRVAYPLRISYTSCSSRSRSCFHAGSLGTYMEVLLPGLEETRLPPIEQTTAMALYLV